MGNEGGIKSKEKESFNLNFCKNYFIFAMRMFLLSLFLEQTGQNVDVDTLD